MPSTNGLAYLASTFVMMIFLYDCHQQLVDVAKASGDVIKLFLLRLRGKFTRPISQLWKERGFA